MLATKGVFLFRPCTTLYFIYRGYLAFWKNTTRTQPPSCCHESSPLQIGKGTAKRTLFPTWNCSRRMNAVEAILHRKQTGVFTPWKVNRGGLCSCIQRRMVLVPAICYSSLYASNSRNYCFTEDGEKLRSWLQKEIIVSQPVCKRYWNGVHHCLEVFGRVCREVVLSLRSSDCSPCS